MLPISLYVKKTKKFALVRNSYLLQNTKSDLKVMRLGIKKDFSMVNLTENILKILTFIPGEKIQLIFASQNLNPAE